MNADIDSDKQVNISQDHQDEAIHSLCIMCTIRDDADHSIDGLLGQEIMG